MDFEHSPRTTELRERLAAFMDAHVYPAERAAHEPAVMEELKAKAKSQGLWNLFLPDSEHGAGLNNQDYAPLAELMGRSPIAPEVFNCSAPDSGNMEILARYGTEAQKERWLMPLLEGRIRSCFSMTEPAVASSDATNIEAEIRRDGDHYVVNGRKWWTSGITDPRCELIIFMGKTNAASEDKHRQQSMLLIPRNTPGVRVVRNLEVFGWDDAPHGHSEVVYDNVRVPVENILLGEDRGFEIAQGRLGPGRIHHCMRLVGRAERCLELMCARSKERVAFGRPIANQTVTMERIAQARVLIDQTRLLTLHAAWKMDTVGIKGARKEIAMIKVAAPSMACQVIDWAIQAHGAAGLSQDFILARSYAQARGLRIADGPDEVHRNQIARLELATH
ncbi:acyl-CoA dehydrogenase family protein [Variovorax sp. Sphag1AA]|uniref:acyl-CoA dehydrogenase family protein n=1 Tax=Variovorax sp. Sphag1AA TaxID=2587027 RepID=UPI00160CC574|nr:acyl-CoA dehydrogenase family protein [Variovorax sp. Sphag1AA]MBB3182101.1 acyl-CoA dehydrogenase [Variovorax sp. Sphag1AA]